MTIPKYQEIPQLAQILVASAKKIGIDIKLNMVTSTAYYAGTYSGGKTGRGTTPWLNTPLNITDYGHRAVPNVFLTSAFKTGGVWSSSDYSNKTFDKTVDAYTAALTLSQQRKFAGVARADAAQGHAGRDPVFLQVDAGRGRRGSRASYPSAIGTQYLLEDLARIAPDVDRSDRGAASARRPGAIRRRLRSLVSCSSGSAMR